MEATGTEELTPLGSPKDERTFLGHPIALYMLFFAEMWERFSYYGMRALLILYMTKALQYTDADASHKYGAYTGLVYATPLIGGMIADRFLGYRKAIIIGGVLMALGHFALAIEHPVFFYGALGLLIAGNGFFKPNISTIVGTLYRQGDPRRDGAFTIFYMGINIGAFLTPLVCGTVGERYGWHYGFGIAGVGMLIGLAIFLSGQHLLGDRGAPPRENVLEERLYGVKKNTLLYIGIAAFIPVAALLVNQPQFVKTLVPVLGGMFLVYIVFECIRLTPLERGRVIVIIVLIFFSITFWACFEQAGSSLNLFTDRHVDRTMFGWEVPTTWFQSVNPGFIVIFAIPFAAMWTKLGRVGMNPSSPFKFALAMFQMALGFYCMVIAAREAANDGQAHLIWLILAYLFHTTGELCLSPVGLSMVTKLSPARLGGLLMGAWFLSSAFANVIGGMIAAMTGEEAGYVRVFEYIVYFSVGAGVLLLLLTPLLKKLAHSEE